MSLQQPPLVHNGKSGDHGLGIWWGFQVVLLGEENVSTFGGIEGCLASRVLEVFSAVEFGVNRPHSGSDHRHGGTQASEHDGDQRIPRPRQRYPDLDSCNGNSRDWRPEPQKEKYARDSCNQIREAGHQSSSFKEMRGSAIEQDRARQHALK